MNTQKSSSFRINLSLVTFPNIQTDNTSKLLVYIGLALIISSGYLYNNYTIKDTSFRSELRILGEQISEDSLNTTIQRKYRNRLFSEIDFLIAIFGGNENKIAQNIQTYFDTIHTDRSSIMNLYLELRSSKTKKQLIDKYLIEKRSKVQENMDSLDKSGINLVRLKNNLDFLKLELTTMGKRVRDIKMLFLVGVVFFFLGYFGWVYIEEKKIKKISDLQIKIHELTIKKMQKELND